MDLTVEWKGKMLFEGAADSGFIERMDTSEAGGGENSAGRPTEFLALGLAGCTGMDVISILGKKQQKVTDFKVQIHVDRATEYPKVFTKAVIQYLITGLGVEEAAVRRAIQLSTEKYCPAFAMLSKAFPMELYYTIFDQGGNKTIQGQYESKLAVP